MEADRTSTGIEAGRARGWAGRTLNTALARLQRGSLRVTLPDGSVRLHQGTAPGPAAAVRIHRPGRLLWRLWRIGGLGLDEAYLAGDWESPDLAGFLTVMALNEHAFGRLGRPRTLPRLFSRLAHGLRHNNRRGSRRNIAAHYDIGNRFYAHWLDTGMTYSSALFTSEREDLSAAQQRKYERILDRLELQPGEHILEIGCGWGGLAEAAARRGARVTAITLSQEQLNYARRRIREAGVNDRVTLRLQDYRDVDGTFDHVVSIEMFEAVGESYWRAFFDCVRDRLRAGGRASLQIITLDPDYFDRYRRNPDFIQRHIFPGGMLPTVPRLQDIIRACGLEMREAQFYGQDYARTLSRWHDRFNAAWDHIHHLGFDERFRRTWRYYLAYCEAGFSTGRIDLMQMALDNPGGARP